ncbi:hypothetical protein [Actinokineospora sp. UTMC 2448]|uniref:hypothetical protein n=1 Tax=Actinokineospora sp. UTMC 2448 TaxID=2268449 RepID=UPI0021644669|nr:hypothetical protein [Actinokineospora sp. UTMC 2448]UVS80580.1 hypothetical protein Actkin_04331 [Actinokineospora sp. UTMC 2448]
MSHDTARLCGLLFLLVALLIHPLPAAAQPAAGDPATVPPHLRHYVVDSAEWHQSPWMTAPGCQGGDFSVYATYLIKDLPELLEHFQPGFAGTDANASARKVLLLRKFRELARNVAVPPGYCVDQLRKWAKPNPGFKPFGFEWGNLTWWDDPTHGVRPYGCMVATTSPADALGPCRGFYITCVGIVTQQDLVGCEAWNAFSDEFVRQMNQAIHDAYAQHPIDGECVDCVTTEVMSPGEIAQEFLNWVAKKGMEQVVAFVVAGVTKLWASFTEIALEHSQPNVTGVAFTSVYNLIAGIALAMAFLGWLVTLATSWRRGHLQFSLFGALKAAVGVTLAGVGAILMLQLSDEATRSLVAAGGDFAQQADFTGSLAKVNPLVAVLAGILIAVCLIFSIIFLVLHGALVLMWTLFGSIAAAGQVHPASSGWLLRWAGRLTALAWAKFAMVGVMLLAQAMLLPLDAGEDAVRQVVDVIQGLALVAMMVTSPYLLMELVDFVSDRIGGAHASSAPAATAATRATKSATGMGGTAVQTMMAAGARLTKKTEGGTNHGSGTAGPEPSVGKPRSEPPPPKPERTAASRAETASEAPPPGSPARVEPGAGAPRPAPANRGRIVSSSPTSGPDPVSTPPRPPRRRTPPPA